MSAKIGVVISSTRPTRSGHHVANWFMEKVKDVKEIDFEIVDLKEVDLPFLNEPETPSSGKYDNPVVKKWSKTIDSYDGFVFVAAEYNNGPTAPLKNAIDTLFHEWARKPVAFVGYGTLGAARSIEHTAAITAKINMMPLSANTVSVLEPWSAIDKEGNVDETYVKGSIEGLVKNLTWWATTLKRARDK